MSYQLNIALGELRIRFFGDVTHGDIVDSCVEAAAHPRVDNLELALIDFSEGDCCRCSFADLAMIASVAKQLASGSPPDPAVLMVTPCDAIACQAMAQLNRGDCIEVCSRPHALQRLALMRRDELQAIEF
jgi:hypothetical protein